MSCCPRCATDLPIHEAARVEQLEYFDGRDNELFGEAFSHREDGSPLPTEIHLLREIRNAAPAENPRLTQGVLGSCCVMQWKAPPPVSKALAGKPMTSRSGKSFASPATASSSKGLP